MNKLCFLAAVLAGACFAASAIEAVPPLKDLRKPVEEQEEVVDESPIIPSPVGAASRIVDPARICPAGAVWYLAVPDAVRAGTSMGGSTVGKLMAEPSVIQTLRNNRFGIDFLFADLPTSSVTPERVKAIAGAVSLATGLASDSQSMAMAGYLDEEGRFSFVFAIDIGLVREEAFNLLGMWETGFMLENPTTTVARSNHSGNYIDVWTINRQDSSSVTGQIAAGFVENMLVVSNNEALARAALQLATGSGDSVATSQWGQRLAASLPGSSGVDAVGYVRMGALIDGLSTTPIARRAVLKWADYIGHSGKNGEALYYGMQFTETGVRETFLLPNPAQGATESLLEVVARRLRPVQKWTGFTMLPYQPNPSMVMGMQMDGRIMGGLLRQERRIFGSGSSGVEHFSVPPSARRLFTTEVVDMLTGELSLAFYPEHEDGREPAQPWIMIVPCSANPARSIPRADSQVEYNGATIMSLDTSNWRQNTSWTVISSEAFRRVDGHYLIIASEGDLILSTVDQLVSGSSFASNKDFAAAVANVEANHGLLFYFNVPEVAVRQYPNLSQLMRSIYPRSSGLNSRPPLSVIRRYAKGITGAIAPGNGSDFTRVTVQSPIPTLGLAAIDTVLTFPMSLRFEGRAAMSKSRENLQGLWLRLQLYSSRYGHFPETLDDLMGEIRTTMPQDELMSLFTAPATLGIYSPEEAVEKSYSYLAGVSPGDEPDIPVIMESQPWSSDFSGMYPAGTNRGPSESGDFVPYRQYIRLDGRVVTMPEKTFQSRVVKRILERE